MRLMMILLAAILAAPVCSGQAGPTQTMPAKPCREHPDVIAPCFSVHGRLSAWNGTPTYRIWVIGTRRMLGISEGRFARPDIERLPLDLQQKVSFESDVFGDFVVCPFEADKPGVMRPVCVDSAARLVVRPRK